MGIDLYEQARAALDVNPAYGGTAWDYQRALLAILDLHKPDGVITEAPNRFVPPACAECEGAPFWPCSSAQAVLGALGLSASTEESRA